MESTTAFASGKQGSGRWAGEAEGWNIYSRHKICHVQRCLTVPLEILLRLCWSQFSNTKVTQSREDEHRKAEIQEFGVECCAQWVPCREGTGIVFSSLSLYPAL